MSRRRIAQLCLFLGLLVLMSTIRPVDTALAPATPVTDPFVEDPPVPPTFDEDPPPPLPDRAIARLGPIKDVKPTGELLFSPDGKFLIVETKTGLQIWNVSKKKLVRTMRNVGDPAFSPDGKTLATTYCKPELRDKKPDTTKDDLEHFCLVLWNVATGNEIQRCEVAPSARMYHLSFCDDGKRMYVGGDPIETLDLKSGKTTPLFNGRVRSAEFTNRYNYPYTPSMLEFSPNTMILVSAHYTRKPFLFRCDSDKPGVELPVEMLNKAAVRLSPDGKIVATIGGNSLHLFDTETAKPLPVPETESVVQCVFSPNGKRIAWLESHGGRIHLCDVGSTKPGKPLQEAFSHATGIAFSPAGNILASTLTDRSIILWDLNARPSEKDVVSAQREERRALARRRVTIKAEKKQYFLGESIYVEHITENVGKVHFDYTRGGDYRGADRHLSYYLEAVHADGDKMPDPNPHQMCFGGITTTRSMAPGDKESEKLELLAYRRLDRPGEYRISAGKGSVEDVIKLVTPTAEQAKKLVEELDAKNPPRANAKDEPHRIYEYRWLTHPVYLPIMTERARAGSYSALLALGQMPDPKATKEIIELLEHSDAKFVYEVQEALYLRMPDPILDKKLRGRNFFDDDAVESRTYLRDKSWRPEFAADVRKHARKCLAKRDQASLFRGAFMLSCLGTAEDLPDFIDAFNFALKDAQAKPLDNDRYPRPPGACGELRRAAQMFVERGSPVADKPKSGGEKILFVEKINRDPKFRPMGWETTYLAILKDELDYVREVALAAVSKPVPNGFKAAIAERIRDSRVDVQIAALHLIDEKDPHAEWKPAVIEVFRKAEEKWLRGAVSSAAGVQCKPLEYIELSIELIDDPNKAKLVVEDLLRIIRDTRGYSLGTDLDSAEKRRKCKATWMRFVRENREKLKEKRPFSLNDNIPIGELFPGIKFY